MAQMMYRGQVMAYNGAIQARAAEGRRNRSGQGPSYSSRETRFAGPESKHPYDWIRVIPTPYARCPNCQAQNLVKNDEFKCWNCGAHATGVEANPDIAVNAVYFNYNVFYKSGGPNRRGAMIQSRNDGNVILDGQTHKPRFCLAMTEGVRRQLELETDLQRKYAGQRAPEDEWRDTRMFLPGLSVAHNILNLGNWHEVTEPAKSGNGTYTRFEPCLSGVVNAQGITLSCPRCASGMAPQSGLMQWWNPRASQGKTPKGHLADLESYVEREISVYGVDGNKIRVAAYLCRQCGAPLLNVTDQGVDPTVLEAVTKTGVTCGNCGNSGTGRELTYTSIYGELVPGQGVYARPVGTPGCTWHQVSELGAVRRMTIYDVELCVHRTGGQGTSDLIVDGWRLGPELRGEADPYAKVVEPFDFKFLSNWSIQKQSDWMHVPDPTRAGAQTPTTMPAAPTTPMPGAPATVPYGTAATAPYYGTPQPAAPGPLPVMAPQPPPAPPAFMPAPGAAPAPMPSFGNGGIGFPFGNPSGNR